MATWFETKARQVGTAGASFVPGKVGDPYRRQVAQTFQNSILPGPVKFTAELIGPPQSRSDLAWTAGFVALPAAGKAAKAGAKVAKGTLIGKLFAKKAPSKTDELLSASKISDAPPFLAKQADDLASLSKPRPEPVRGLPSNKTWWNSTPVKVGTYGTAALGTVASAPWWAPKLGQAVGDIASNAGPGLGQGAGAATGGLFGGFFGSLFDAAGNIKWPTFGGGQSEGNPDAPPGKPNAVPIVPLLLIGGAAVVVLSLRRK